MKIEHTPGPWKYVRESHQPNWLDLMLTTEDDAKIIGWIYNDHEVDARLIAAAPEMLATLIYANTMYKEKIGVTLASINYIIEKATGKTWAEIIEAGE